MHVDALLPVSLLVESKVTIDASVLLISVVVRISRGFRLPLFLPSYSSSSFASLSPPSAFLSLVALSSKIPEESQGSLPFSMIVLFGLSECHRATHTHSLSQGLSPCLPLPQQHASQFVTHSYQMPTSSSAFGMSRNNSYQQHHHNQTFPHRCAFCDRDPFISHHPRHLHLWYF